MASGAVLVAGLMTAGAGVAAASPADGGCVQAGTSGFTAKVVATAGQRISHRWIDATGCDVGIYVAAPSVTITNVTVTGANAAGILAMDTHAVTITRSDVYGNGFNAPPPGPEGSPPGTPPEQGDLPQAFGISLFGVSDSTVTRNSVHHNGRGGIGVMDDGPNGPGRIVGGQGFPANPVPVSNVLVSRNTLWANFNGCAIVVSAFNAGNTVRDVTITRNTVRGTQFSEGGADVGGIVAQSNGAFSTVRDITISRNTVTGSLEVGAIVHAAAPGSKTQNVRITRNTLSGNNLGNGETGHTTGVLVSVIGPPAGADLGGGFINPGEWNENTVVSRNTITDQFYGVWTHGPNPPTLSRNSISVTTGGSAFFSG